jgi:hypothetical protein
VHQAHRALASPRRVVGAMTCVLGGLGVLLGTFLLGMNVYNSGEYDAINRELARQSTGPEDRVLRTFQLVSTCRPSFDPTRIDSPFRRWLAEAESASPLHLAAVSVLIAGTDPEGPCGSLCRSMIVLLHGAGFEIRKAILYMPQGAGIHTVVEVKLQGKWRVFDPTYAWYWRCADGEIATAEDLARDPELLATVRSADPHYPLDRYVYTNVHHLRWEKVPGLSSVRWLLVRVVGEAHVREIGTPYLYERPYLLAGLAGLGSGLVLLGLGIGIRRWVPHTGHGMLQHGSA